MRPRPVLLVVVLAVVGLGACSTEEPARPAASNASAPATTASAESDRVASARGDVDRIAPRLELRYFMEGYPDDVAGVVASMQEAGFELTPGNTIGGYLYDEADVDFRLCVQTPEGAWAIYDTSPMTILETGEGGGCPAL